MIFKAPPSANRAKIALPALQARRASPPGLAGHSPASAASSRERCFRPAPLRLRGPAASQQAAPPPVGPTTNTASAPFLRVSVGRRGGYGRGAGAAGRARQDQPLLPCHRPGTGHRCGDGTRTCPRPARPAPAPARPAPAAPHVAARPRRPRAGAAATAAPAVTSRRRPASRRPSPRRRRRPPQRPPQLFPARGPGPCQRRCRCGVAPAALLPAPAGCRRAGRGPAARGAAGPLPSRYSPSAAGGAGRGARPPRGYVRGGW